jgi:hypothetical protein
MPAPLTRTHRVLRLLAGAVLCVPMAHAATLESIEFVGEHLPEIAMDNRYATLPLWSMEPTESRSAFSLQAGYAYTHTETLAIDGPMLSAAVARSFSPRWHIRGLAFLDELSLTSGTEHRPLEVNFASDVPLALPAAAEFTGLSGEARDRGVGVAFGYEGRMWPWHAFQASAGILWQQLTLSGYHFAFRVTDGIDAGATGTLDYSATYSYFTPFIGLSWPRDRGNWRFAPHVLAAMPLPRRGVVGEIQGNGYDLSGDTGTNVHSRPFGDPSLTVGFDVTYRPWNVTFDVGTALTQVVLEPVIHEGVQHDWMISFRWN